MKNRNVGGSPKQFKFDEVDNSIKEILGARIEGLPSEFDDDANGKHHLLII